MSTLRIVKVVGLAVIAVVSYGTGLASGATAVRR